MCDVVIGGNDAGSAKNNGLINNITIETLIIVSTFCVRALIFRPNKLTE